MAAVLLSDLVTEKGGTLVIPTRAAPFCQYVAAGSLHGPGDSAADLPALDEHVCVTKG